MAPAKAPAKDTARFPARRIARYSRRGHRRVEGWLTPLDARLIRAVGAAQEGFGIYGGVGEIGVHHGKLFILLYLLLRQNERGIAIDIFDRQELNVDRSGKGNLDRFLKNTTRCAGRLDALEFLEKNSRSATADEILQKLGQPARLFSVDGGHTAELTLNDLTLADETLCPGGIAILDDCFNRHWPAVSEGLATFMSTGSGRMVPFAIGENKVLLCRPAMQTRYLAYLTQRRRSLQFLKTSEFYGYETAIFQHPRTVYARLARMPELRRFVERHSTIARLKPLISRLAG